MAHPATQNPSGSAASGGESLRTVVIAFAANLVIAVAKSVAAVLTGSASMLAEAAHSWADTGNEIFLMVAERKGKRGRDAQHPMGFGRETYVWSMFAAFGLFTAGAIVSIWHGITELRDPEPAGDFLIAYVVLGISFVLEGLSFRRALGQSRASAKKFDRGVVYYVSTTSDPTLRAVFAEDSAALTGLVIAALGIALHQVTGSVVPDAIGSILIGLLLGVVAIFLINQNRRFLVGQVPPPEVRSRMLRRLLERPDVDRVTYLHLEFVGPNRLYLVAAVDLAGDDREPDLAVRLRGLGRQLEVDDLIEEAILTLSTSDEPALQPD